MKALITSIVSLAVGLVIGFFVGYRYCDKHSTTEVVQQMMQGMESSDSFQALVAVRTITLIDSGESSNAVQFLSRRIGDFYRTYAHLTNNDKQTKSSLFWIEELAKTNRVVADEIYAKHE